MDKFTQDYLIAALWSSTGDDDEPLDRDHSISDIAPEAIERAEKDCAQFQAANLADFALADLKEGHGGHNFWLSRVGHGSGFFDEHSFSVCPADNETWTFGERVAKKNALDLTCNCPYHACQRLQDAARKFGNVDIYKGDDSKLYFS